MGLSSRIACAVAALAGAAALGSAGVAQAAVAAHPMVSGAHPMMRPPIVLRGSGVAVGRGPRVGQRGARRGYGYGLDGLGLAGFGLATTDAGFATPPDDGVAYPPPLPPPFALPPPPPRCPLIIEVGRGLSHKVETHVVSGRPFCIR